MELYKQKVLLVDDIQENILSLESILENENLIFLKAGSGEEALKILLKEDISLILLDVQMPGMDGFETASLIRGKPKTRHIPIIFVTAISKEQKHIFKGYESGAVDYLFKPVEPKVVRSKAEILLELDNQRRTVESQNSQLVIAKKDTDNILTNVEEGLFLLDSNFKIRPQYSKALEGMLGKSKIANQDIRLIFKKSLPDDMYETSKDYLNLMFKEDIAEVEFSELNPLIECPFYIGKSADKVTKYLTFNFRRIYSDDNIEELIVTVTDDTEHIILEQELEKSKNDSLRQVDLLHILKVEPQLLKEFINQTEKEMQFIVSEIDKLEKTKSRCDDITEIYSAIHSLKGNSSLLDFQYITEKSHRMEEIIKNLTPNSNDLNEKVLQLKRLLTELNQTFNEIKDLIDRIKIFHQHYENGPVAAGNLIVVALSNLVKKLEVELDKKVEINHSAFDESFISNKDFLLIKDVLIQLTRNSIYHSFEKNNKKNKDKPEIKLISEKNVEYRIMTFEDNGIGIQYDKLKEKALATKKWTKKEIENWTDDKIIELIFQPGIS
ncbi:MAG: response regulator, partial [Calditrichaceae bacterium]